MSAFERRYLECSNLIIGNVTSVLRAATPDELKEATLTAVKERVKREINEVLRTSWVQEVIFIEVSYEVT